MFFYNKRSPNQKQLGWTQLKFFFPQKNSIIFWRNAVNGNNNDYLKNWPDPLRSLLKRGHIFRPLVNPTKLIHSFKWNYSKLLNKQASVYISLSNGQAYCLFVTALTKELKIKGGGKIDLNKHPLIVRCVRVLRKTTGVVLRSIKNLFLCRLKLCRSKSYIVTVFDVIRSYRHEEMVILTSQLTRWNRNVKKSKTKRVSRDQRSNRSRNFTYLLKKIDGGWNF